MGRDNYNYDILGMVHTDQAASGGTRRVSRLKSLSPGAGAGSEQSTEPVSRETVTPRVSVLSRLLVCHEALTSDQWHDDTHPRPQTVQTLQENPGDKIRISFDRNKKQAG